MKTKVFRREMIALAPDEMLANIRELLPQKFKMNGDETMDLIAKEEVLFQLTNHYDNELTLSVYFQLKPQLSEIRNVGEL